METRILVPLNGNATGEAVLPKLDELVFQGKPKADAEVILLQVISHMNFNVLTQDPRAQLPIPETELKELTAKAQEYLNRVEEKISRQGIKVKTMISVGSAAEEIIKAAHETKANLIAMSTHGRNGIVRWALGSVTDKVLRLEGTIPVLAVNTEAKKEGSPVIAMGSLQSLVKH